MEILLLALMILIALEHFGFLLLEAVFWTKPAGRKVFRTSPQQAEATKVLALNQGVYNGFLSAGLLVATYFGFHGDWERGGLFALFFLSCVIVAGIVGALTVSSRIFFVQALPAILALAIFVGHFFIL